MVADWTGDNSGPRSAESQLQRLRAQYPGAHVHCSTFSAFFDEANKAENKAKLPVVTAEMGDAWIYGVPSDPLKNAQFREVARARDECVSSGACNTSAPAMRDFDRLLVKVPEHTWGLAQSWFTADYQNYTNVQFQRALKDSLAAGPLANQSDHRGGAAKWRADYYTTIQAWWEQRSFVTNAIGAVANAESAATVADAADQGAQRGTNERGSNLGVPRGWADELARRVAGLSDVPLPSAAALITAGYVRVPADTSGSVPRFGVQCGSGGIEVGLDVTGAIVHLTRSQGQVQSGTPRSVSWANTTRPIGQFLYQTFDDDDYQKFLGPAPAGFGLPGCTPNNTAPNRLAICGNFNKPNMTAANPTHVEVGELDFGGSRRRDRSRCMCVCACACVCVCMCVCMCVCVCVCVMVL